MSNPPSQTSMPGRTVSAGSTESRGSPMAVSMTKVQGPPFSFEALGEDVMDRLVSKFEESSGSITDSEKEEWFNSLRKRIVGDVAKRFHEGAYVEQEKDLFQKVCALYRDAIDASTGVNMEEILNDIVPPHSDSPADPTEDNSLPSSQVSDGQEEPENSITDIYEVFRRGNNVVTDRVRRRRRASRFVYVIPSCMRRPGDSYSDYFDSDGEPIEERGNYSESGTNPVSEGYNGDLEDWTSDEDGRMSLPSVVRGPPPFLDMPTPPQSPVSYGDEEDSIHSFIRARNVERSALSRSSTPIGPLREDDVTVEIPIHYEESSGDLTDDFTPANEPYTPLAATFEEEEFIVGLHAPTPLVAVFSTMPDPRYVRHALPATTGIESVLAQLEISATVGDTGLSPGSGLLVDNGVVDVVGESARVDEKEMTATAALAPRADLVLADSPGLEGNIGFDIECEKMEREAWEARRRAQYEVGWAPRSTPVSRV